MSNGTIFDVYRPMFWYFRFGGNWFASFKRTEQPYKLLNILHIFVYFGVSIALWLIHLNSNDVGWEGGSPYLIYCVWFANQIALTFCIGIGCLNLFLFSHRWLFLEKIIIIDRDLRRHFNIRIPYEFQARITKVVTFCLIFRTLIVTIFVIYFLFELIEFYSHVILVSLSITIIIASRSAVMTEFYFCARTIYARNRYLNSVLQQLLFKEPNDNDKCIFIDPKYRLSSDELGRTYRASRPNIWHTKQSIILLRNNVSINKKWPNIRKNDEKWFPDRAKSKFVTVEQLLKSYRLSDVGNFHRMTITDLTFTQSSSADFILQKLRRLFLIYDDLLDCVNILSNTCVSQVLVVLITSSILIAICLFVKFRVFADYTETAYNISQMFLLVGMDSILFDFIPSFWVSTEAILTLKTTANIVGRIALKTSDPQILTKLFEIQQKLMARRPSLAVGSINLDGRIMISIISTLCTYLVMALQFYNTFQED